MVCLRKLWKKALRVPGTISNWNLVVAAGQYAAHSEFNVVPQGMLAK